MRRALRAHRHLERPLRLLRAPLRRWRVVLLLHVPDLLRRGADGRYRRHPLLLQFAEEQLSSQSALRADAAQRHVAYFAQFLQAAAPDLYGAAQAPALARIRLDMDNIRRAWQLAGEQRAFDFFEQVLDPLMFVFDIAGLSYEACDLCLSLIHISEPTRPY